MELSAELQTVRGVGPAWATKFGLMGIRTVAELLDYFPRDYKDYSSITPISSLKPGEVTLQAKIRQVTGRYVRRGMHITEAVASDSSGSVRLVWFNQPYRPSSIKVSEEYFITGKLELKRLHFNITNPAVELAGDMPVHTARIVPVYRESKDISTASLRRVMFEVLKASKLLPEPLPLTTRRKYGLLKYGEAVAELHFPSTRERFAHARKTIGFLEVFSLMLAAQLNKNKIEAEHAQAVPFNKNLALLFARSLPFKLTDAQRKVTWQIYKDIENSRPMNRLLEGDVGSGKTIVAAMAGLMVMDSGLQVALMAPTEILARQHAETLSQVFKAVGMGGKVSLLTGSMTKRQKELAHKHITAGDVGFIVGTQALLQDTLTINKLGLLIVDEQHRFGVEQRKKLLKSATLAPHVLSMTATPIPRSLALTLYGELAISVLDTMPPGRKPIVTTLVSPNSREKLYMHIEKEITAGRQIYMVCPNIGKGIDAKVPNAEDLYEKLRKTTFKHRRLGLMHGRLKDIDKNSVMQEFINGDIDILVSTTVIEVGISIANASVMVIEGADRFGLAQMHQLRGRVGRGEHQGYCFIIPSDSKAPSRRLRALEQSTNGFELAELDLEIRGPGAIYGTLQHGELDLRIARLSDAKLLAAARSAVVDFMAKKEKLSNYPDLSRRVRAAQAIVTLN